jgi:DNA-binding transcriptional LysR family regulator
MRHFAALAAIARERSFRRAGERLGYAQSAISRQIAHLEQLTGARVIERSHGPRPVHLTEAGDVLLAHANDILASMDAARADLAALDERRPVEVRIGFFPGVATRVLPAAMVAFGRRCPSIRIMVREALTDATLCNLVRRGSVDLAFVEMPAEPGTFESLELLVVPWALVVPASADIASRLRPPTAEEIARLPLIESQSTRLYPWEHPAAREGFKKPHVVFRCDGILTAQALAGAGVGAALIPRLAVQEGDPRTAVIDLHAVLPPLTFGLIWSRHRRLHHAAVEFSHVVRLACSTVARSQPKAQRLARDGAGAVDGVGAPGQPNSVRGISG